MTEGGKTVAKNKEVPTRIVFGTRVEAVIEMKGFALKIKHSVGPNGSFGEEILEQHFVMPRQRAEELRDALTAVLGGMPPRQLNA